MHLGKQSRKTIGLKSMNGDEESENERDIVKGEEEGKEKCQLKHERIKMKWVDKTVKGRMEGKKT